MHAVPSFCNRCGADVQPGLTEVTPATNDHDAAHRWHSRGIIIRSIRVRVRIRIVAGVWIIIGRVTQSQT
jgi:hypothetical protein